MLTAALGMIVGVILALTGAGGGVLSVPLLVFVLHLPLNQAAPVGLLAITLSAGIGAALGLREHVVRYRAAGLMALAGMCMTPAGLWLAQRTPNRPLAVLFAAVLALASARMLLQAYREMCVTTAVSGSGARDVVACHLDATAGRLIWTLPCARAMTAAGLASGFLSGLLGVGGGFVIVPALRHVTDLPMRTIVATSLAVITLVSLAGVISSALMGTMPWTLAVPFAAGAGAGLLLGRTVAQRLAGPHLQLLFAVVGMGVAVMMVLHAT